MQKLFTRQQIKSIDEIAAASYHIPAAILMENAATNCSNIINKYLENNIETINNIAIFCGSGNNGGDGFAIARHLSSKYNINVYFVGKMEKLSQESKIQYEIIENMPQIHINIIDENNINDMILYCECIIDAMFGVGFSGELNKFYSEIIHKINDYSAIKIAIDVPSGLDANIGSLSKENKNIIETELTTAILGAKIGMYINNKEHNYCGEIAIAELGVGTDIIENNCNNYLLEKSDVQFAATTRYPNGNKYYFGRVLVIAGSRNMQGAAALVSNAAISAGAGIVTLITPETHLATLPEVITYQLKDDLYKEQLFGMKNLDFLQTNIDKADSIVIGPGITKNDETLELVLKLVLNNLDKQIVIDADAISALDTNNVLSKNIVLTPHFGEFLNLINNNTIFNDTRNPFEDKTENELLLEVANKMNCNILLKGPTTLITDGEVTYWNNFGNPGMATAGSGDVLSGIIGAILARNNNSHIRQKDFNFVREVAISSLIHSLAGDYYSENYDMETLTASEIIKCIKFALKKKYNNYWL